jgi:hypothetical protein
MTGLKLIPVTFSFEIDLWGQFMKFFCLSGCCRLNFIILGGKLAAGHKKKYRNPYGICLIINDPKHYRSQKHTPRREIWVPIDFLNKKVSKGFQVSTTGVKVHFGQRVGFCQKNSCTCEFLGNQYEWK